MNISLTMSWLLYGNAGNVRNIRVKGASTKSTATRTPFHHLFPKHFSPFVQKTSDNDLYLHNPFSSQGIPSTLPIKRLCVLHLHFIFLGRGAQLNRNLKQPILFCSHALGRVRTDNFNHVPHKTSAGSSLASK